jgi:hypothetical protein
MLTPDLPFKARLVVATLCLICLAFLGMVLKGSSARISTAPVKRTQGITPYVTNKTKALGVVSVKTLGEGSRTDVEITLINQSTKNIIAYVLSTGSVSMTTQTGFDGEAFAPGQIKVDKVPFSNVARAAENNPGRAGEIILSAVFSTDGTGEGEPRRVAKIKNKFLGMKDEVKLILPLLRRALNSTEADSERAILTLETQASQLPIEEESDKTSHDYRNGRSFIKDGLQSNIKNLKERKKAALSANHREGLTEIIAHYERFLSILQQLRQ